MQGTFREVRPRLGMGSSEFRRLFRAAVFSGILLCLAEVPRAAGCRSPQPTAILPSREAGAVEIRLECAATPEQRQRGLMFRSHLGHDQGMLFLLRGQENPSFWMKNTFVSLDIFFLGEDGRVVDLAEKLMPCAGDPCPVYRPATPCCYALEVAGGTAMRHGIKKGDRIELHLPEGTDCAPP